MTTQRALCGARKVFLAQNAVGTTISPSIRLVYELVVVIVFTDGIDW